MGESNKRQVHGHCWGLHASRLQQWNAFGFQWVGVGPLRIQRYLSCLLGISKELRIGDGLI